MSRLDIPDGWHAIDGLGNVIVSSPLSVSAIRDADRAVKLLGGIFIDYMGFDGQYLIGCPWQQHWPGGNRKTTDGKVPMALLPLDTLAGVAKVLDHGKLKYPGIDNWREPLPQGDTVRHYVSAALRHLAACQVDPKAVDKDSGLPHIDHAVTSLLIASHHTQKGSK